MRNEPSVIMFMASCKKEKHGVRFAISEAFHIDIEGIDPYFDIFGSLRSKGKENKKKINMLMKFTILNEYEREYRIFSARNVERCFAEGSYCLNN